MSDKVALVRLRAKNDQYDAAMAKSGKVTRDMAGAGGEVAKSSSAMAAGFKLAASAGAVLFARDAVKSASDLAEAQNKANVIFGESAGVINAYADAAATGIGMSKQAALDATGTFGNMFDQLGVGSDQAAEMSTSMVTLAADFGSFHNADSVAVTEAMSSAFRGEYDALQKFVPTMSAAAVEQQAMADTGKTNAAQLTAQDKALAAYNFMLANAGEASGDFARTSDGLANQQKILNAEWQNAKADLGEALIPAMKLGVSTATELLTVFDRLTPTQQGVAVATAASAAVWVKWGDSLSGVVSKSVSAGRAISEGLDGVAATRGITKTRAAVEAFKSSLSNFGSALNGPVSGLNKLAVAGSVVAAGVTSYNLTYKALEELTSVKVKTEGLAEAVQNLAESGQGLDDVFAAYGDGAGDVAGMADAIRVLNEMGRDSSQVLKPVDEVLAAMARTDPVAAKRAFGEIRDALNAQGISVNEIVEGMPSYFRAMETSASKTKVAAASVDDHTQALKNNTAARLESASNRYDEATAIADAEQARRDAIEGVAQAQADEADAARGVADAQASVADARRAVGDAMDAEADARRAVGDAMRAEDEAARGVADAQADVVTATQDLADARREATGDSDAMRDALDDIASAEERLAAAQRDSTEAQQALDDVRSNYQQTLTGLADNQTLDEIAVRDAQRRLDEARARAANPQEGDNAQELRDNITEAEIALRRARDQLAESTDTLNRNQANGVEGSDAYLQAQEDLTTAHDNEADAVQGVADAVSHREEVQAAADQAVSDAEATLAEKVQAVNDAQQRRLDAHQAVLDAQGKVAEAARGVRDAEAEVRDRLGEVAIAQQALVDAKQATLDARNEVAFATAAVGKAHFDATGNINDYADALEDALALMDPNDPHYQATMAFLQALRDISRNSLTGGAPLPSWLGGPRSGEKSGTSKITADQIAAATDTPALAAMHAIQSLNAEAAAQIAKGEKEYRQWLVAIAHLFGAAIDMAAINAMVAQAFPAAAPNVVGPAFNWGDEIAKFYANGGSTYGSAATGNYANPYHGAPPPLDPDRMARAIAESMPPPVHLAAQVDARGLNAHQATTLVGAELMDQIRAAGMR